VPAGDATYVFAVIVDVTDRKKAQDELDRHMRELERSNNELEQFAYVASHDLQEPLRMVGSYVQLLERRYGDQLDSDAKEFIGFAVEGASRMQQLINDLLTLSRVGRRGREISPMPVQQALKTALSNLRVALADTGATVTHDPLPYVMGDETQLAQLFQNLIANALKFRGEAPPRVHVGALQNGTQWVFSVKDNGIGIQKEYHDRIFLIFQRLHTREQYPGTGIGLALCKRIVDRHNGRIWVDTNPEGGSTFYFTLTGATQPESAYAAV
jgi:light-regulated signal transduction histidine kinase (bacteriophytochrome)